MKIVVILLILLITSACSCNKKYDVYVNGVGYNLNDTIVAEVKLKTEDASIIACPIISVKKEDEEDANKIKESIGFKTENVEFFNLYVNDFQEKLEPKEWQFLAKVGNNEEEISLKNNEIVEKAIFKIKEKGNYEIALQENTNDSDCINYKEALTLTVKKN